MKKKWEVHRETYSVIDIEAETYQEAEDILSEIDGDDDGWEYYKEEIYLRDFSKHTYPNYDEYSMTHTVDRDDKEATVCSNCGDTNCTNCAQGDDVNEGKSITVSTWISKLNDMDRILLNRIEALEDETKKTSSTLLSFQKHVSERMLKNRLEALNKIGELEKLTQKLIDIQVNEDVDRHDDLTDELWNHKK